MVVPPIGRKSLTEQYFQFTIHDSRFTVIGSWFSALIMILLFLLSRHRFVSSNTGTFNKCQVLCMVEVGFLAFHKTCIKMKLKSVASWFHRWTVLRYFLFLLFRKALLSLIFCHEGVHFLRGI